MYENGVPYFDADEMAYRALKMDLERDAVDEFKQVFKEMPFIVEIEEDPGLNPSVAKFPVILYRTSDNLKALIRTPRLRGILNGMDAENVKFSQLYQKRLIQAVAEPYFQTKILPPEFLRLYLNPRGPEELGRRQILAKDAKEFALEAMIYITGESPNHVTSKSIQSHYEGKLKNYQLDFGIPASKTVL